ncbi:MAG: formylmethanofuran--tetrahydromethanopterin N-formyltransferase [Thermoleophilia bacterium]
MHINGVEIDDTFAEAFDMWAARLIITGETEEWARTAAAVATGLATSIIGCGCEAGVGPALPAEGTPDGRPGYPALFFTVSKEAMQDQLLTRVGQGVMTAPTSACYDGLSSREKVKLGSRLRYFGDGFQVSKFVAGRRLWRIPVMDGEFVVEESAGVRQAVGGGNFFILAETQSDALVSAQAAVAAMREIPDVIMPFPGGIVRSGSKVSSRYKGQNVSSNTAYCPTLRAQTVSALPEDVNGVLEIVVNGLDQGAVRKALQAGIPAACRPGVVRISAGNYGGRLGRHRFDLHKLMQGRV